MINISGLTIIAEESKRLLSSVSLQVSKGDRIAIYGHGGSGKSLLLDFLGGIRHENLTYSTNEYVNSFDKKAHFDFNGSWVNSVVKLVAEPIDLSLIDEPENGVSLESFKVYSEYMKSSCSTLVFVTHNLQYVEECCDKVLVLKHGEDRGTYEKDDFFNNSDPYIQYVAKMGC